METNKPEINNKKLKKNFNPVKEQVGNKEAESVIWTTVAIEQAVEGLNKGLPLKANPFLDKNIAFLKPDLVYLRTDEETNEFIKCMQNILYFAENYCFLQTPNGKSKIILRDYQKEYLQLMQNNRFVVCRATRQAGKTTTTSIYLLWKALFSYDKTCFLASNKLKSAKEIMSKIKDIFKFLPYYLKPGCTKNNETELNFDNGSKVIADATTKNTGIGYSLSVLYVDEAAHISPSILEEFYSNIYPTIAATKGQIIMTSSIGPMNLFYRICKSAEEDSSEWVPYKIDWYQVPEWDDENKVWYKRDEKWKQKQIANLGSEEAFNGQFGINFDISANTLISIKLIREKQTKSKHFIFKEIPWMLGKFGFEFFRWDPQFNTDELKYNYFLITCDLGEGVGGDYTIFNIWKLIKNRFNKTAVQQIGFFRSNTLNLEKSAKILWEFCRLSFDQEKYLLSFEKNTYGDLFCKYLLENNDLPNITQEIDEYVIYKYQKNDTKHYVQGLKMDANTKRVSCLMFKESVERYQIDFTSDLFITECENFTDNGKGSYQASWGHDDIIMSSIQLPFMFQGLQWKELEELFNSFYSIYQDNAKLEHSNDLLNHNFANNMYGDIPNHSFSNKTYGYNNSDEYNDDLYGGYNNIQQQILQEQIEQNNFNPLNRYGGDANVVKFY